MWLGDIPVAVITKATDTGPIQMHYIHADHLKTSRVIVDTSNTPVWRWDKTHASALICPTKTRSATVNYLNTIQDSPDNTSIRKPVCTKYFRYYEPETGRYISPDPIGLAGGMNVWGYVGGNPISKFDFLGLAEMCNVGFPISFGIPHTFLCANGSCAGYYPSGNAFFSDGKLKDDSLRYTIASCSDVPQKNCTKEELDNCISNFIDKIAPTGDKYNFYANNCGQWATKVITYCRSQRAQ